MAAQIQSKSLMGRFKTSRAAILLGGAVVIFLLTYFFAWWSAYRLSQTYMKNADASFNDGRYLDAFQGYEEYSRTKAKYVQYGGYVHVERIWSSKYAFPAPSEVRRAEDRIDEIINERLTTADAEAYVQENIGRNNPYVGRIYLRLGELYEADGELRDAEDIYESIPDLFPNDQELIDRAMADLANLQQEQSGN
jgi:tetratricopeptide (TPR) repeat protein